MNAHIVKAKSIFPFLLILICSIPAFSCADTDKPSNAHMKEAEQFNTLGESYYNQRKFQEAVDAYKQAISVNPYDADAHYNLGLAYRASGKKGEASDAYKQLIRIKPNDYNAHYDLGMTYLHLDNTDSALDQYTILKDLNKDLANTLFNEIGSHSK